MQPGHRNTNGTRRWRKSRTRDACLAAARQMSTRGVPATGGDAAAGAVDARDRHKRDPPTSRCKRSSDSSTHIAGHRRKRAAPDGTEPHPGSLRSPGSLARSIRYRLPSGGMTRWARGMAQLPSSTDRGPRAKTHSPRWRRSRTSWARAPAPPRHTTSRRMISRSSHPALMLFVAAQRRLSRGIAFSGRKN
jgi:hypothetical protein